MVGLTKSQQKKKKLNMKQNGVNAIIKPETEKNGRKKRCKNFFNGKKKSNSDIF